MKIKSCPRCKKEKPIEAFSYKNKRKEKRQSYCKKCSQESIKNHYKNNKEYYLQKAQKRNHRLREKIKTYIWDYLSSHPCIDCGEKDPIVLEFDHQKDKIKAVSEIIKGNYPTKTIEKEIAKCVVRCANCHRRKTARDYKWYTNIHRRL